MGVAPIAPTVLGAAPQATAAAPAGAIATVSAIGYAGSFAGPPLIGALAELTTLTAALALLLVAALAVAVVGANVLASGRTERASTADRHGAIASASQRYYDHDQRTTGP